MTPLENIRINLKGTIKDLETGKITAEEAAVVNALSATLLKTVDMERNYMVHKWEFGAAKYPIVNFFEEPGETT